MQGRTEKGSNFSSEEETLDPCILSGLPFFIENKLRIGAVLLIGADQNKIHVGKDAEAGKTECACRKVCES